MSPTISNIVLQDRNADRRAKPGQIQTEGKGHRGRRQTSSPPIDFPEGLRSIVPERVRTTRINDPNVRPFDSRERCARSGHSTCGWPAMSEPGARRRGTAGESNGEPGGNRARRPSPKGEGRAPEDHPDQRLEREREELSRVGIEPTTRRSRAPSQNKNARNPTIVRRKSAGHVISRRIGAPRTPPSPAVTETPHSERLTTPEDERGFDECRAGGRFQQL